MVKDNGENEPKSRGGRRSNKPKKPVSEASLKNLRGPWQPGQSGNPAGKPKSLVEITKLARELTPAAIMKLNEIVHDPDALDRDKIAAAIAIADRGCGKPAIGVFHGTQGGMSMPLELEDGTPLSALLLAARGRPDEKVLAELNAEVRRLEAKIAQDRREAESRLAEQADALARGEEISPVTALLLRAKAANAEADRAPKPEPKRIEAKPDFIVDSTGNAAPAPLVESAPPAELVTPPEPETPKAPEAAAAAPPPAPPKTPRFQVEPAPIPAAKPARKPTGFPAFDEFSANKARVKAEDEERARKVEAARAQGRPQISAAESFPPDPREGPEIVRLGRIPGGHGIRRV